MGTNGIPLSVRLRVTIHIKQGWLARKKGNPEPSQRQARKVVKSLDIDKVRPMPTPAGDVYSITLQRLLEIADSPRAQEILAEAKAEEDQILKFRDLGEVKEIEFGGHKYEVLLGLKATKKVRKLFDAQIGADNYRINHQDIIVAVNARNTLKIVRTLRDEGLRVDLLDGNIGEHIGKENQARLLQKGISRFPLSFSARDQNLSTVDLLHRPPLLDRTTPEYLDDGMAILLCRKLD